MAFEDFDQAAQALADANNGIVPSNTDSDAGANQPVEPGTNGVSAQDNQPRIDVNSLNLTPEQQAYVQQREREMQADYTRKTQEVAAQRREAEQALEFINALNTDPQFALQVHQTLSQALEQQNLLQAQQQQQAQDEFVDPYMQKINELEQWKNQQEQQFRVQQAEAQIQAQVSAIRAENPNYKDEDIRDILTMAFAYNGDVRAAHDAFKQVTQRTIEGYMARKETVPTGLNQPSSSVGHAEVPPEGFKGLNDPRLEEAAKRMLLEGGAQW